MFLNHLDLWQRVKCSGWNVFEYLFIQIYPGEVFMYRAHPSEGGDGSSVVRETWFLLLIGGTVLTLVLGFVGMLYLRRRQALSKELGHLNGM
jgi:roundabout axon guidance receptor 2